MALERTPMKTLDEARRKPSGVRPKKSLSLATKRKIQRSQRRNRFKISMAQKKPATQRKRAVTQRRNLAKNVVTVGGRLVRRSQSQIAKRVADRLRKQARTGRFSVFSRKSGADDLAFVSRVEAYENLVWYLNEVC